MNFTLNQEEYESLIVLARLGAVDDNKKRELESWLRLIEKRNGVTRSFVLVKWQELNQPLPQGTFFPTTWPPELQRSIEYVTRPVSRADVDRMLEVHAKNPTAILCTRDPSGVLGLTPIDDFFTR